LSGSRGVSISTEALRAIPRHSGEDRVRANGRLANPLIIAVGDIEVARRINRNSRRMSKLSRRWISAIAAEPGNTVASYDRQYSVRGDAKDTGLIGRGDVYIPQ
jgi:hypothetical protein